jgi:hypothetical protein
MNFLNNSYTLKFNLSAFILFISGIVIVAAFLYWYRANKKGEDKQKTGFLGKPLIVQIGLVLMGISVILGGYILSSQNVEVGTEARKNVQIHIEHSIKGKDGDSYLIGFQAVPSIDSKDWGSGSDTFDILWSIRPDDQAEIKGQKALSFVEISRSKERPSEFNTKLIPGTYTVKVVVSYASESYEEIETIKVP